MSVVIYRKRFLDVTDAPVERERPSVAAKKYDPVVLTAPFLSGGSKSFLAPRIEKLLMEYPDGLTIADLAALMNANLGHVSGIMMIMCAHGQVQSLKYVKVPRGNYCDGGERQIRSRVWELRRS